MRANEKRSRLTMNFHQRAECTIPADIHTSRICAFIGGRARARALFVFIRINIKYLSFRVIYSRVNARRAVKRGITVRALLPARP